MKYIASLPWYDHPKSAPALNLFWASIKDYLVHNGIAGVPTELNRTLALEFQWQNPGLLLSQCCGPDLFTDAADNVSCLGRPVFNNLDCPPGYYYSHIVSNRKSLSNPRVAINSLTSWSGNAALRQWLHKRGEQWSRVTVSGSHQTSLSLLRQGQVDLVAIDAHTWPLLDTASIHIIGRSALALTPPFISGIKDAHIFGLVREALINSISSNIAGIGISRLLDASKELYKPIVESLDEPGSHGDACLGSDILLQVQTLQSGFQR